MIDNNPIQSMLDDLQGRYSKLNSDLEKLKDHQKNVELLQNRVNFDDKAREVLLRLDAAFPDGFKKEKTKIMSCISQLKIQFKQLETQLENINTTNNK